MTKKSVKRFLAAVLASAMMITSLPASANVNDGAAAGGEIAQPQEPVKLAELTFDDTENPLAAGNATATAPSGYSTVDHNSGKALSLDGSSQYIELKKSDGNALLKGKEEIVISYDIKNNRDATNWIFFAAPHSNSPGDNNEYYLGTLYGNTSMTVERYYKNRNNTTSSIVTKDSTYVFKNGEYAASNHSNTTLSDILGENGGVFYIGKATWEQVFHGVHQTQTLLIMTVQ